MKKYLTLVLALVLAFGLTVPAMAFTSDDSAADDSIPYDLSIYLVEYDDNDLFGIIALPESDRGYAKNEIVAAVIELDVPEDEDPMDDGYTELQFRGDNVDFDVSDDPIYNDEAEALGILFSDGDDGWTLDFSDANGTTAGDPDVNFVDDTTYKWLVFAKVTDDDASMTAKLVDGTAADEFDAGELELTLDGIDYVITNTDDGSGDDFTYEILIDDADSDYDGMIITIDVDEDNVSLGMSIDLDGVTVPGPDVTEPAFALGVNTDGELGLVDGATIDTSSDDYDDVMDVYEDVVVDVFGMDYFLIGNYVRDSFFEDLVSADTLVATVDIEPWTAYVTVPDNIVVDPPKTGDAASIMGFVMVALAGSSAVALKKRG